MITNSTAKCQKNSLAAAEPPASSIQKQRPGAGAADVQTEAAAKTERKRLYFLALLGPLVLLPLWLVPWGNAELQQVLLPFTFLIAIILMAVTAVTDARWKKIPNWLTYPAFAWGIALNLLGSLIASEAVSERLGTVGIWSSLVGALVTFVVTLFVLGLTGGGAGDIKLLTALGALLGLERVIDIMLYGFVAAGVACLVWGLWTVGPLMIVRAMCRWAGSFLLPQWIARPNMNDKRLLLKPIPLAPYFAVGTVLVCFGLPIARLNELFGM